MARLLVSVLTFACLLSRAVAAESAGAPAIVLVPPNGPRSVFEVRGLSASVRAELAKLARDDPRWPQIFGVYVSAHAAATVAQPPMLGAYKVAGDAVRFSPRFPLERGVEYRALFNWQPSASNDSQIGTRTRANRLRLVQTFVVPAEGSLPPARVMAIYPSSAALPENILRFYVQFSAPMSQGSSYGYVRLRDASGAEVDRPFLELPQELWSPDGTRLTLLFEPGRVKRGLVPRAEQGPILIAGRTYSLTVDGKWLDAEGRPLEGAFRKTFRVVEAEVGQLDPLAWKIVPPKSGSREPLEIRFPKPLDHAMLERVLRVFQQRKGRNAGETRTEIAGTVRVADEESRWSFEPRDRWSAGRYSLAVSTTLEDRAGNSIARPFEVDLNRSQPSQPAPALVQIEFEVRERP
jgi:hypothetical protein